MLKKILFIKEHTLSLFRREVNKGSGEIIMYKNRKLSVLEY